jgi:CRP/FNR family transcriptional regulator
MDEEKLFKVHGCATCNNRLCVEKIDLFSNLSKAEHIALVQLINRKTFDKGELIFDVDDRFDSLYIINAGRIKIHDYTIDGDEKIYYILEEGDVLGEISLLKQTRFNFMATALEPTKICMINKEDFDEFIRHKPEITFKIFEYAHRKIQSLEDQIQILLSSNAMNKVAGLILKLKKEQDRNSIELTQTQREMANAIGITRETFSRKLNQLKNDQIITIDKNQLKINKIDQLYALSPFNIF